MQTPRNDLLVAASKAQSEHIEPENFGRAKYSPEQK